jgi:CBS-domain-containing membrane protein
MMGAALGGIIGHVFGGPAGTWALMGMAGALAGVTRSPLTSVVFAFELSHDTGSLLPLLITCALAHLVSVLVLKRSILTEKVARKGFHVMREYAVDPLEALFVGEVAATDVLTATPDQRADELGQRVLGDIQARRQRLIPVVANDQLVGVVGLSDLLSATDRGVRTVGEVAHTTPVTASASETLRAAADRMAAHLLGALPVVDDSGNLVGVVTEFDLLAGRRRQLVEDRHRERTLRVRLLNGRGRRGVVDTPAGAPTPFPAVAAVVAPTPQE